MVFHSSRRVVGISGTSNFCKCKPHKYYILHASWIIQAPDNSNCQSSSWWTENVIGLPHLHILVTIYAFAYVTRYGKFGGKSHEVTFYLNPFHSKSIIYIENWKVLELICITNLIHFSKNAICTHRDEMCHILKSELTCSCRTPKCTTNTGWFKGGSR